MEYSTSASSCAILISSCDAYADLWRPYFTLFERYWADCPFPVYLVSNERACTNKRVVTLPVGNRGNWSDEIREALQTLATPYVLLTLEDFFLRRPVSTDKVLSCLDFLQQQNGHMLRMIPRPAPDASLARFPWVGQVFPGAPYRVSTQATIWHRQTLLELIREGETIWEFELNGSRRSDSFEGFYSVWEAVLPYDHHVVERGKWFRNEAQYFGRMDVGCDFSRRPIMTRREMLRWYLHMVKGVLLGFIPWPQRLRLVHWLKRFRRMA